MLCKKYSILIHSLTPAAFDYITSKSDVTDASVAECARRRAI